MEDLFPSRRGRPSVPAPVIGSVLVLQALQGLSDRETAEALTFNLRWKENAAPAGIYRTLGPSAHRGYSSSQAGGEDGNGGIN